MNMEEKEINNQPDAYDMAEKEAEKQAALEEEKRKEEEAKAAEEAKKAVYISKAGKKYHTKDCRYTGKSSKKVTRAEAIEMGKKPGKTL